MLELLADLGSWLRDRLKRAEALWCSGRVRGVKDLERSRLGRGGGFTADVSPNELVGGPPSPPPFKMRPFPMLAVSSSAMS
jgi:hypothetical protein